MQIREWTLTNKPTAFPTLSGLNPTFTLNTTLPALKPNQVLTKPLYLSNDPGMRPWISANADPKRQYLPPIHEGEALRTAAIVRVVESTSKKLPVDSLVFAFTEWRELSIRDESECQPLAPIPGLDIAHFLGALGMPAITAYYGLKDIVKAQPGETVIVSGAAGAMGSMAVQIATNCLVVRLLVLRGRIINALGSRLLVRRSVLTTALDPLGKISSKQRRVMLRFTFGMPYFHPVKEYS